MEVMELCVQLKVCEGCGVLWCRSQDQGNVYCKQCETRFMAFPLPESQRRRKIPRRKSLLSIWAVAEETGGAQ